MLPKECWLPRKIDMGEADYKVSIITVVYNGVKTIEQTIKSVLQQSYKNIEYIIIDGASTDGTQKVIEKYAQHISYYVSEEDEGLYHAMNKGINMATGDIIGIINSDDWYAENIIGHVAELFKKKDLGLVYGKTVIVSEDGTERERKQIPLENIWYEIPMLHTSVFVKRDVYDRLGVFNVDYKLAADCDLLRRFYSSNVKFGYLDEIVAYFRLGGLSSLQAKKAYEEEYKIAMLYADKSPCRQFVIQKIKEMLFWAKLSNTKEMLSELLCNFFHKKRIDEIIIFGTGVWGNICYNHLIYSGVKVLYFVDNDSAKWNTEFHGIGIISPENLIYMDVYVLAAVKESGEEIKQQLLSMRNSKLKWVSLMDLEKLFRKESDECRCE